MRFLVSSKLCFLLCRRNTFLSFTKDALRAAQWHLVFRVSTTSNCSPTLFINYNYKRLLEKESDPESIPTCFTTPSQGSGCFIDFVTKYVLPINISSRILIGNTINCCW